MRAQPRYLEIVQALEHKIASDQYGIGKHLPSEHALCAEFNVSRFTIRHALNRLREAGLVAPRQGSGTMVAARRAAPEFVFALGSLAELMQYAETTQWRLGAFAPVVARGALARRLRCSRNQTWLHAEGLRYAAGSTIPLCWTETFVRSEFTKVCSEQVAQSGRIFTFLETEYGETIREVEQRLTAALVTEALAEPLQAASGAPALLVERRYLSLRGRVVQVSFSLHPAERFSYVMRMRRETAREG